jgi:mRNA interferase RelE/StbE
VPYRIVFKESARRELAALPIAVQKRLDARLVALADNPRPAGVKALQGQKGLFRLRVGDYRVIYHIHDEQLLVLVIKIGHRREVYRAR